MKFALIALGVIVILAITLLVLRRSAGVPAGTSASPPQTNRQTLEDKLAALAECGLVLSKYFTVNDLLESWGRDEYEADGFALVLVGLGMTEEEEPWRPHCENLWHFDTECIEGDGSYVYIAKRMASLAGTSLPLEDLQDHVDNEAGEAWLRFKCQGREIKIDCEVQDDWVDSKVFGHFVELLKQTDPNKLFIYYNLGGQDCLLGCITRGQFESLKKLLPQIEPLY